MIEVVVKEVVAGAVEEASRSQSETEDSSASPEKHATAETSASKDDEDLSDDDSTDVEDSDTIKQNVVHAGDGDKADGMSAVLTHANMPIRNIFLQLLISVKWLCKCVFIRAVPNGRFYYSAE